MEFTKDKVSSANISENPSSTIESETAANHTPDNDEGQGRLNNTNTIINSDIINVLIQPAIPIQNSTTTTVSVGLEMSTNTEEKAETSTTPDVVDQVQPEPDSKKSKPPRKFEKPKEEVTFRTHLTSLAHVSVVVFVYLVLKLAFRGEFVFFTWHPILMSVGWMLLMTEGFYAINKYNTYWRFKTKGGFRVKIHVAILSIGYILSVIGFIIVYINKENSGKHHFVSWHGLFGLIGLISTCPPVINGFLLWYKKELENYITYPRLLKFVHVSSGTLAFTFGALSLLLSVYTNWFGKKSNHSDQIFYLGLLSVSYPLVWAVYGPSVKLTRVIKEYFSEDKED